MKARRIAQLGEELLFLLAGTLRHDDADFRIEVSRLGGAPAGSALLERALDGLGTGEPPVPRDVRDREIRVAVVGRAGSRFGRVELIADA